MNVARTAPRSSRSRGAVMVEFALVAPVLVFLLMGALELSVALRSANGVESASAAGARVASQLGDDPLTDYYTLDAVRSAVGEIQGFTVTDVIVFIADSAGRVEPPPSCLTPPSDRSNQCNHYTAADLATLDVDDFGQGGPGHSCDSDDLSKFFCPGQDREVDQSAGLTYVGVWVQGQRESVTGMLPWIEDTVSAATVMRSEPQE